MTTLPEFQIPEDHQRGRRRQPRHVHRRAPRQGLRLHLRQLPAPRAAVLARRRRDQERPHRGRRARVLDDRRGQGGRHRHRPQPQGHRRPHAHRRRRGRGAAGRHRPRRGQGQGHRPARGRRDPQPRRADRDAREEDQARDVPDDRPRPRLLAGGGEQVRGPADRRDPDRLDLLADPPRVLRRRLRPRRAADRLRQAHARGRDRRLDRAGLGAARGGRDPDQDAGDLHRRRPRRGADRSRRARRRRRRRCRRSGAPRPRATTA